VYWDYYKVQNNEKGNPVIDKNRLLWGLFILLAIMISGCSTRVQEIVSYPNPDTPTFLPTFYFSESTTFPTLPWPTPTPTYDPNNIPPEFLFTATPDPNAFTITANLEPGPSEEDIARILFSKWLEHYSSEKISLTTRIDDFSIQKIFIPMDQKCAEKLGAEFIANANIRLKTTYPLLSNNDQHSDWVVGSGNIVDQYHIDKPFDAAIFREGNKFTIQVIMQVPMCDP
jgi:hypothetical protein